MSETLNRSLADFSNPVPDGAGPGMAVAHSALPCFHCGEPCPDLAFSLGEKAFCCQGCRIVHDLLTENGLGQFYSLDRHPGVRVREAAGADQWAFVDDPAVSQRLLDFADATQSRVTFHIPAIHCVACVWLLENLFRLHPGIGRSQVNFTRRSAAITFAPQLIKLSELVALLNSIGYAPALNLGELDKRPVDRIRQRFWLQVGVAGFAFGNIMLFSIPQYFGLDSFSSPSLKPLFGWLSLALALPAVVYSASDYWKAAWLAVRQRIITLDVPIALGLAAIYIQSAFEILSQTGEGYCDSLTGLIFFLLCGRAFQHKTQEWLAFDRDYRAFFPLSVTRKSALSTGTREERISLSQLEVGDCVVIRNREIIPADAKLLSGPALIDYSFVTGESQPVAKESGDYVYAGGQQMGAAIELETVKAVSQSYLTSLWNHESFRKSRGEDVHTLSNRYSRRFTVLVVAVALGSAVFWMVSQEPARGLKAFISVLIVACPCALALAAPFTLGTAQRWLARAGVFLKNALVLERMARVNTIVFDKTGTLTSATTDTVHFAQLDKADANRGDDIMDCGGKRSATPPFPEVTAEEKHWICSLTRHSTHPHSARITEVLGTKHVPQTVESFVETPGSGVSGRVLGHEIVLGTKAWLQSRGATVPALGGEAAAGSVVHAAIDRCYRGAFVISGRLRPDARGLIAGLGARYELALLSGDNERERERFRELFGANARLNFNQGPLDKLGFIGRLQDSGRTVMMVGDGLNDAGALRQSDVGVAVVEQVGAFSPASDVILNAAQLSQLGNILILARRAARIVRISFAISAAYNVVGVSIAAAGLLSPLVCAILMPVSSVSVVLFACSVTAWAARRSGFNSGGKPFKPQPKLRGLEFQTA